MSDDPDSPDEGAGGSIEPGNSLAKIEQLVPSGWRMKLAKAAAQLSAGSKKGAVAYGQIRERLDTIEGRSIVARGLAEAAVNQAVNDPKMLERANA
jgi:hypothetical protein